ncbi:hypothetical protein Tco_0307689 [Tanacetum coccineum]
MFENAFNSEFKERIQKYTRFDAQSFKDAMICSMDSIGKYMLEIILHQQRTLQLLKQKKLMQTQEDHSNPIPALNVDSLKVDLVVIQNTCFEKDDSNSETASNKLVKESSLNSATKFVHAIKHKMSKEKERSMAYFRSLHSHLQVLSKEDLKGTRIEHGFKRAFMSLFGQDVNTFTSTMLLNVDQLQKQLDKDEFQEDGSMAAFWVVNNQFQKFIDSQFTLDYDSQMTDKYFAEYTGIEVKQFRDTLLQLMGNVKKSVAERTRHQRQYDRRVNKRQMQTQESKIDTGKAVDDDLVVTESSGTESEVQDDNSRSGNDTDADDADIRPIYDEEPMAEVQLTAECNIFAIGQQHTEQPKIINEGRVDQYPEQRQVKSPMLDSSPDNQTTDYSKQSLESENILLKKTVAQFQKDFQEWKHIIQGKVFAIAALKNDLRKLKGNSVDTKFAKTSVLGKPVIQSLRNQSVVRQLNAFKSKRPQMSKPRFASQVDVNNNLSRPVTQHYLPKRKESVFAKPDRMIASNESQNSSKNMPRFSSNDMVHNHYLDEARKKTQERDRNSKTSVMPSARFQSTADGSKPKPRSTNHSTRSLPISKSSFVTITVVPKADHSKSSSSFSDSKHFVCSTCHKNSNKLIDQKSHTQKPSRQIFTRNRFSPNKTSTVYEKTSLRSDLSEPIHSSNVDIPNIHESKQSLDLSADEIYSIVDACKTSHEMWIAIERLQQGESLNIQDVKTNFFWEFGKFTSQDEKSMESYYSRFYKLMNEMIRNNLIVATMQVNVQFLQQLQPEWSRFVTIVKQQHELDKVSYHKLFDILKQYQKEVNEIRAERIAKNANPLALVAAAQSHPDPYYQALKHKGKEIAKPITPPSESASEEDNEARKKTPERDRNSKTSVMPSARFQSTADVRNFIRSLFDEYFNGENQVVSKSSAVTTADASDKRQQQPDSTSSTSTLATTVTADGNFDL